MRIVVVGPVPPLAGGIAQHTARLVTALRARGHQVDVWTWAAQYPPLLYRGRRTDPSATPLPDTRVALRWWDPTGWWRAGRAARRADLVVLPWVVPPQAVPYRTVLAGAGPTPAVGIVHNPLPHEPGRSDRWLAGAFLPRLAGAVCHAEPVRAALAGLAPGVPTRVVPHPPNLAVRARPLPGGPPWRVLFLGHLRPYKGIEVAMAAIASLAGPVPGTSTSTGAGAGAEPGSGSEAGTGPGTGGTGPAGPGAGGRGLDVTLTVAGQPWLPEDHWRAAAGAAGAGDRVRFRFGYVPDTEVEALLADHHLVVTPYLEATQSGVIALAHAAGRPVVASDAGGLPEAVHHGVDGLVTRAGDPAALAAGIADALDRLDHLAAGARDAGSGGWDAVAAAVEDLAGGRR